MLNVALLALVVAWEKYTRAGKENAAVKVKPIGEKAYGEKAFQDG